MAYAVLFIGLVSTFAVFHRVRENIEARDRARFEGDVSDARATIQRGITRCVDQVFNVRALFAASRSVRWSEWQAYLNSMTVRHSELGIRTLGYIEKVTPATLPQFLRERQAAGQPDFTIIPAGERQLYFPSVYITHFDSKADVIIGLDHAVKPERLSVIEQALGENKPAVTRKAYFMGRDGTHTNFGMFVYLPVYHNGMAVDTVPERRDAIVGLVYMTIDSDTLPALLFESQQSREIGKTAQAREIDIEVFDGSEMTPEKLIYSRDWTFHAREAGLRASLTHRLIVPVLNRQWTVFLFTTPKFDANSPRYLQWLALGGGLMISLFLFAITFVQVNARARAERDAAELHKSEAALAAQIERLAVTLDSIADGVITTNASAEIISINPAGERLTGWAQKEAEGRPLAEVFRAFHTETREPRASLIAQVLRSGASAESAHDLLLVAQGGGERIVTDSAAPVHKGGEAVGAVLVFHDVTEKRRNEEQLLKESKLESVGLLAGGIAHDFNNILTSIIGNVSLARMTAYSTNDVTERLEGVEKSALRAKDLTQQLLTFAKGGAPIRKWMQLPELVRDVCQFSLHGSNVRIDYSLPTDTCPVEIDEGQFRQALNHLVINAMQATPNGGQVEVKLENVELAEKALPPLPAGNYVKLSICDHGPGIGPEKLPHIFEPYFQPRKEGSGLGMATAYSIVRKHEGQIRVNSTLGSGTVFQVYLPASLRPPPDPAAEQKQSEYFGHGRILIMDDEADVLKIAGAMLRMCGYEVETTHDGADLIELYLKAKAAGRPFDALIVDLTVPNGMGGREAISRLKEQAPEVRAIVSSGYSFDPVMANYRHYGFRGIIPKPYRFEDLARVLREVLGEPAV